MEFTVTQKHIDAGRRDSCFGCPVAIAIEEKLGYAGVWDDKIEAGETTNKFPLPSSVRRFVSDFDAGRSVQPFTFSLPLE